MIDWVTFTKRTNDPKLSWLEDKLDEAMIPHKRDGKSFHAPICKVPTCSYDKAMDILILVDDIPDNDKMFEEVWLERKKLKR
jgi:hypothetical protein